MKTYQKLIEEYFGISWFEPVGCKALIEGHALVLCNKVSADFCKLEMKVEVCKGTI